MLIQQLIQELDSITKEVQDSFGNMNHEELKREFMIGVQELKRGESFHGREFINRLKANNLQNCGY